ncbi:hypothetical protein IAG41_04400 [Sphingomonas sp. JC676]|uniref:hypothetical protein n=1 Tax=Sphingomonas sp. JC676 TaxID=2768065 RepID=UPI00165819E3|nr:hypothetical protein [Sphingomonas sp. JC676]MBC9031626.1 hypothetical protein [Sphingomonas sp. JC676]
MTDISVTSPVERIARVLAAEALSINGDGEDASAASEIDAVWFSQIDRAIAVLKTLREPTPEMVQAGHEAAGDPAKTWNAMVRAALEQEATAS